MATSASQLLIAEGDLVIVFASRDRTPVPLCVKRGEQLNNMFGNFQHDDMIGRPYGSKLHSRNRRGFVYLLRPSPELWTISLPHRTQILYAPDMSFITLKLNLSPGASVIEAGTGSGSFTHFLARTVACGPPIADQLSSVWKGESSSNSNSSNSTENGDASGGRVWSFEFHRERVEKAKEEFAAHGIDKIVSLAHRNVYKDGFGLEDAADALFLDLPAPWEAIPFAPAALKKKEMTRICCFSPCIEQVLRTVTTLSEHGFTDIATYESLVRTHDSLTNVGQLETVGSVIERIRTHERKREARREMQIAQSRAERAKKAQTDTGDKPVDAQDTSSSSPTPEPTSLPTG
ncbi:guanidinoacetate N-methyltransferase [Malassezia cuniculi]|uniref:tRNA (adenine(58)-N(1))-methyltransferase catalytic subunit TRM61 n=1 Tax=Malassezia cuniculi TaxID=948313 RepID=A0AAF0F1S8_9BASI|nr:guanidinoacetate N-methyltransferase [Malassezia cuniculi]